MVNQIQQVNTQNISLSAPQAGYSTKIQPKAPETAADSFQKKEGKKFTKLEMFLSATTIVGLAAFAHSKGAHLKTKEILESAKNHIEHSIKTLGEDVSGGIEEGLTRLFDFASKDGMTGLLNKKSLKAAIAREYTHAVKNGENLSVAMIDIDNFKGINEVEGHGEGDHVLQRVATNIQQVVNKHGLKAYRYGGEEFAITGQKLDSKQLHAIMEEVSESIGKDDQIQGLVTGFKSKANPKIEFHSGALAQLKSIFPKLRTTITVQESKALREEIISFVENYMKETNALDNPQMLEIVRKVKELPEEKLTDVLNVNLPISNESTLGNALGQIEDMSRDMEHVLVKSVNHLDLHKRFTISGGVANLQDHPTAKDGMDLIHLADKGLLSAKQTGRNKRVIVGE